MNMESFYGGMGFVGILTTLVIGALAFGALNILMDDKKNPPSARLVLLVVSVGILLTLASGIGTVSFFALSIGAR